VSRVDVLIVRAAEPEPADPEAPSGWIDGEGRPVSRLAHWRSYGQGATWRVYTTLDRSAADRVATALRAVERSSRDRIEVRETDATLVHTEGRDWPSWAWWSDGVVTTSREHSAPSDVPIETRRDLPRLPAITGLSADARELFGVVIGSDSGRPACGWSTLARVGRILSRTDIATGKSRGHFARDTVERIDAETVEGEPLTLYTRSAGYSEGYTCEVAAELSALLSPEELEAVTGTATA
jgi:hypothetical protein